MKPFFPRPALLAVLLLPTAVFGDPRRGPPTVVLYADPDFRGEYVECEPGTAIEDLRDLTFPSGRKINDKISSIRLVGGARVTLFADPIFSGDRIELAESVRDLRQLPRSRDGRSTWDDCITSLQLAGWRHHRPDRGDREPPHCPPPPPPPPPRHIDAQIALYADPDFRGESLWIEPGAAIEDLRDATFESGRKVNDKVSSIRIERGARVTLFADPIFSGDRIELTESVRDLRTVARSADGRWTWDDCVTSLRAGRDRRGGRGTGERDPEDLINRAFRELLNRAPTRDEMRFHRTNIIDRDWTNDLVRAEIKRSREYRIREADRIIQRAYVDLLGREPEPGGYENYRKMILDHGWSEQTLRSSIRESEEYRRRQHGPPRP